MKEVDPVSTCLMKLLRVRYAHFLAAPAIVAVAEPLDPIIDELRRLLIRPTS